MKIKSIKSIGLQGKNFAHNLGQMALVTGDNASGKTAITHALQLGLLGHLPKLGKTNAATASLASGKLLEVQIDFWGGLTAGTDPMIRRSWQLGRSIKGSEDVNGITPDQLESVIPAALDFSAFTAAKPTERQRILEAVMGDSKASEKIAEELVKLPGEVADLYRDLTSLQPLEKRAGEESRAAKQELDRLKKALQQLEVEALEDFGDDYDADKHAEAKTKLENLKVAIAVLTNDLDDISNRRQRAPEEPTAADPTDEQLAGLKKLHGNRIADIVAEAEARDSNVLIDRIIAPADRAISQLKLRDLLQEMPKLICPTIGEIEQAAEIKRDAEQRITFAKTTSDGLEAVIGQNLRERDSRLAKLEGCETCPTCNQETTVEIGEALKDLFDKNSRGFEAELKEIRNTLEGLRAELSDASCELRARQNLVESWAAYWRGQEVLVLEREIVDLEAKRQQLPELPGDPSADYQAALHTRGEWNVYRAAETPTEEQEKQAFETLTGDRAKLEVYRTGVEGLDRQQQASRARNEREGRRKTLEGSIATAEAELTHHKGLRTWAKQTSLEDTAERMKPLLGPANEILKGVVNGCLEIEGTAIGLDVEGSFRQLEVLSGSELASVAAAVQAALASASSFPIIIVDELSRLRVGRREQLLRNLATLLVDGPLENVIATDHDEAFISGFEEDRIELVKINVEGGAE